MCLYSILIEVEVKTERSSGFQGGLSMPKAIQAVQRGVPSSVIYNDLGISQQVLSYWARTGIISPSIRKGKKGHFENSTALWSYYDVLDIKTIDGLKRQGLSLQKVRGVLKWIKKRNYSIHTANIITDGQAVFCNDDASVIEFVGDSEQYMLLDWSVVIRLCRGIFDREAVVA